VAPVDILWFPEFRHMGDDLPEIFMGDYIQIARNGMSRWVIVKRRIGTITYMFFFKYILNVKVPQYLFVIENFRCNCIEITVRFNWYTLILKNTQEHGKSLLYNLRCFQDWRHRLFIGKIKIKKPSVNLW